MAHPRIVVSTLLLALAVPALPAQAAERGNFEGFSLGASVGASRNHVDYAGFLAGKSSSKTTAVAGLNASYTFPINETFLLTTGVTYVLNSAKFGQTTYQSGGTVYVDGKLKDHWSVFVAPGVRFDRNWLAYAKIGYHAAKADFTDTLVGPGTTRHHGIGYGLGVSYAVSRHIEVNTEINHVRLNSAHFALSDGRPSVTELDLGINYRF